MSINQRIRKIVVNRVSLAYVEAGEGEPVVLIHGSLSDFRTWGRQVNVLSRRYRVIAYSRRDHYPNAAPENGADYSVEQHVDDLIGLFDGLGLERARVIGSSLGAYVALLAASRGPERFVSLVAGEPPIFPLLRQDRGGSPVLDEFLRTAWIPSQERFREGNSEAGVRLFYDGITAPGSFDRLPAPVRTGMLQNAASMKAEAMSRRELPPFTPEDARRVTMPVLLLTGEASPALFPLITDRLEAILPRTERAMVPHSSHSIHTDNPDAFNELVMKFFERDRLDQQG